MQNVWNVPRPEVTAVNSPPLPQEYALEFRVTVPSKPAYKLVAQRTPATPINVDNFFMFFFMFVFPYG
jgi:hypothetical protein